MPSTQAKRILILTPDVLSTRMAGPAIRAFHMAKHLAAEHDVRLLSLAYCDLQPDGFSAGVVGSMDIRELELWCDIVVLQGSVTRSFPSLFASRKPIVVDLYDPFHLEVLQSSPGSPIGKREQVVSRVTAVLNEQLRRGDFFLCASNRQRDMWLGHLAAMGRVNPYVCAGDQHLESLLAVVPFGLPGKPPVKTRAALRGVVPGIGPGDTVLLWGGGIYPWLDPLTLIRAVASLRTTMPNLRLFFMGLDHPLVGTTVSLASEAQALAEDLGVAGTQVIFNRGWVDFQDRHNYLLEADIGVSTHSDHLESAFSFRTRILDYLWAGLPIVTNSGDAMGELVAAKGLGLAVPPGDAPALAAALRRMVEDTDLATAARDNMARLAPLFTWSTVLKPLVEFCRNPARAADTGRYAHRDVVSASEYLRMCQLAESLERANERIRSLPIRAVVRDRSAAVVRRSPAAARILRPVVRFGRSVVRGARPQLTPAVEEAAPVEQTNGHHPETYPVGSRLLNIGSGEHPMAGWVNVDLPWFGVTTPDVYGNALTLPFPDGVFDRVYMGHFLEHLRYEDELVHVLAEIQRVARPGAVVAAVGPCILRAVEQGEPKEILRAIIGVGDDGPGGHKWVPTSGLTVRAMELGGLHEVRAVPIETVDKPDWPNPSVAQWQCAVLARVPDEEPLSARDASMRR